MIAEKVTIFVLCLFLLSSLSTSGNIWLYSSVMSPLFITLQPDARQQRKSNLQVFSPFLRLSHLENWLLIDQGFLMLDAGLDGVMVRWTDLSRYQSKMLPCR